MRTRLIVTAGVVALVMAACVPPALSSSRKHDEGRIAFASNRADPSNLDIWSMKGDGSGMTRLTTAPGGDLFPAWSPDSRKIAFRSRRDGNSEIYTMNADGSAQTRLTDDAGTDDMPAWSPDGKKIVFASARSGGLHLWLMNADGSSTTQLTSDPASTDIRPNWSPNGKEIVFTEIRAEGDAVFVLDLKKGTTTQVTDFGLNGGGADWSSEGNRFVIADNLCATCDLSHIQVLKRNGTGLRQLTSGNVNDILPAWSGDSESIAFARSDADFTVVDVWVMRSDGSHQVNLTNNPPGLVSVDPAWSSSDDD
jgi:Tol biopolymer transport system component